MLAGQTYALVRMYVSSRILVWYINAHYRYVRTCICNSIDSGKRKNTPLYYLDLHVHQTCTFDRVNPAAGKTYLDTEIDIQKQTRKFRGQYSGKYSQDTPSIMCAIVRAHNMCDQLFSTWREMPWLDSQKSIHVYTSMGLIMPLSYMRRLHALSFHMSPFFQVNKQTEHLHFTSLWHSSCVRCFIGKTRYPGPLGDNLRC